MHSILPKLLVMLFVAIFATGCATNQPYDYSAYKQIRPHSILILPPINDSPDVNATYSVFAQMTHPLAEAGYYVFPVTLVDETFKQNGLTTPADIHAVAPRKLQEIFGADAALYVTITRYGTSYMIISSAAIVAANAKLVDLKTGKLLWQGSASASSEEGQNNSGGLAAILISAIIKQIASSVFDASHNVAGLTSERLLSAGHPNGILYGPRSPLYGKD
ncbi:putative lipoprotein NMB1124/NMB1162 [Gammaproteobacteria bacterium]